MPYSRGGASGIGGAQRDKETKGPGKGAPGRGGGGAVGGQGGAGTPGSGAGSTGQRDAALGGLEKGTGFGGFLDRVFGYENLGQRVNAYSNNPNRPGGKFAGFTGTIPSFPQAGIGYGLLSLAGAPLGPVGFGMRIGDIALGGTGHGMFADAFGGGPGKRGPDVGGGGTERGGRGGALMPDPLQQATQTQEPPKETPDQQKTTEFKKRLYALGLNGVPAPLGYQYNTAKWL